jgi:hypothetical protein
MAAEFHFAKEALALHLLLQHFEGLIDIVVTDENLHAALLFDRMVDGHDGQAAQASDARMARFGYRWHPWYESTSIFELVPTNEGHCCQLEEAETSVCRCFLGSSSNNAAFACIDMDRFVNDQSQDIVGLRRPHRVSD